MRARTPAIVLLATRSPVSGSKCPRPTGVCTPSQRLHQHSLDRLTRLLEEGMANGVFAHGDPKLLAFALFGAVNWIPRWYIPDGPASSQAIADLFADFFVGGLRSSTLG